MILNLFHFNHTKHSNTIKHLKSALKFNKYDRRHFWHLNVFPFKFFLLETIIKTIKATNKLQYLPKFFGSSFINQKRTESPNIFLF